MSKERMVELLMERYGRTYAEELGIELSKATPAVLFQWLCASLLFSARISVGAAASAARALLEAGWTTAKKLDASSWSERTRVLNRSGYARYDESTSRMLGENARRLLEHYGGDLRRLREEAGRDPRREQELLQQFKGIGPVGAAIFCREVQAVWQELYPFADMRSLRAAEALGLGKDPKSLAALVKRDELPRLVAALVRADLAKDIEPLREAAKE